MYVCVCIHEAMIVTTKVPLILEEKTDHRQTDA